MSSMTSMKSLAVVALFSTVASSVTYSGFQGHCVVPQRYIWPQAEQFCEETYGTTLVSIHSDEDDAAFKASRPLPVWGYWTGLRRIDGELVWSDGTPYDYELDWRVGQPSRSEDVESCIALHGIGWNDYHDENCDTFWRYCFVCWEKADYGSGCTAPAPMTEQTVTVSVDGNLPETANVKVELIENEDKNVISSDGTFSCNQDRQGDDTFCVSMNICNNACDGVETIEITVYADVISGNVDLLAVFGMENTWGKVNFMSYVNDMKTGLTIPVDGVTQDGGVFTAPKCDGNRLMTSDFNGQDFAGQFFTSFDNARRSMSNGHYSNFDIVTEEIIGQVSSITYTIVNDRVTNTLSTTFSSSGSEDVYTCDFVDTTFDTDAGNDYLIYFANPHKGIIEFEKFDVSVTCTPPASS